MNPITRKSLSKLVTQPSLRAVGQTHAEWQKLEKPENNRHMYGSQAWVELCKLAALMTNFDMLFLVMGFISLVDEIQFMLISIGHICIRYIVA